MCGMRTSQSICRLDRERCNIWLAVMVIALIGSIVPVLSGDESSRTGLSSAPPIEFARDVWPILEARCVRCHGPDHQESGYRLDDRQTALTGGDSHAPNIIPGNSEESHLVQFISGLAEELQMPPEGDRLSQTQIDVLKAWIDLGAPWGDIVMQPTNARLDWWSLKPIVSPEVPVADSSCHNELDAFVRRQLSVVGIAPSPEADRRSLLRRLYFDLIGLPPSPDDVAVFAINPEPNAYERCVDRLLASPQYGERWARHWMDGAHFAETHGHDQDRIRENAWPYRDYLIQAFNEDRKYERFVREQIAGDVLFPDDPQATVALGFLAAGPWDESSLRDIREDTLDRQVGRYLDRDDILANVFNNFMSTTVQCARCHDHKFDPVTQADYYSLQAVFSGVERANRVFDRNPDIHQRRQTLLARRRSLEKIRRSGAAELMSSQIQDEVTAWERDLGQARAAWKVLVPRSAESSDGTTLKILDDASVLAIDTIPEQETYTLSLAPPPGKITALRLELLTDDSLPQRGPGRQDNGNLHLSELEVYLGDDGGDRLPIAKATSDFEQVDWGISRAIDQDPQTAWGIFPRTGQPHEAVFEFQQALTVRPQDKLRLVLKQWHGGRHLIGRFRLSITDTYPAKVSIVPAEISAILSLPAKQRTQAQLVELALFQRNSEIDAGLASLPAPSLVYAAASDFEADGGLLPPSGPRPIQILRRGDIRQPIGDAAPGSLSCVPSLSARFELHDSCNESERRAALAAWLTDRENPLVWRSIVNRVWQYHFGRGLVATCNDFGRMGAVPTNPELLDWLAAWFRDNDQSIKRLHHLIVTSATYRQTSAARDHGSAANTLDADNRFLWRMNRTRLDAECIHDAVLAVSGRLNLRMGGTSDRQFELKPGSHVTPIIDYRKFDLDSPLGCRRSVYRFLFRTLPDPFMESLDCPAGDLITPLRENSVNVQQSLAMWNDAFIARHCEHFAARLRAMGDDTESRVQAGFEWALSRPPNPIERLDFAAYVDEHGLENFCRVLLNLNEFVFVD